ncbi:MAG: helicase-exonuclease AddAB subunit AddA [Eubacteriales bacterium]|nr:helicase-exonuclease AddAB subunit AddA [Eubacteriales bacterium]
MGWTPQQNKAIETRNCSILVSASAGSGKTAILVERILQQILDKDNPCNIDEFLVVTFTNQAAAQMRNKIAARLEKELENEPENEHLMRQLVLVNHADITTIDSFCLRLVKEHFSLLDLDSVFNIGDDGMMTLIKTDVITELFDEQYAMSDNRSFYRLLDIFCDGEDDAPLMDAILRIHNMASSFPRPRVWIENAKLALQIENISELNQTKWFQTLIDVIHTQAKDALTLVDEAASVCEMPAGPDKYYPMTVSDAALIQAILDATDYEALYKAFQIKWQRLATCKGDEYDEALKDSFKQIRDQYKAIIKKINLFRYSTDEVLQQIKQMQVYLIPLLELVLEFMDRFEAEKDKRCLMDFADIEHLAYRLVCEGYDTQGKQIPTLVGKQVSERYREIYIDEYQDSNFLQEDILCSVSGMYRDCYNLFMVGDVKQSIYRFRMARPDLFLEKYHRFSQEGKEVKIELLDNFRSRDVVLHATNYFFYQLMGYDLGGILYDESVALIPGAQFQDAEGANISTSTELLVLDRHTGSDVDETEDANEELAANEAGTDISRMSGIMLEAEMVAKKIFEIVNGDNPLYVYDAELKKYRPAQYRDIVILGRSVKKIGEPMRNALGMREIPVYLENPKGYFNAVEIRVIVSLLSVIDNARQDIPLSAVLLSPIAGLGENELAKVCAYADTVFQKPVLLYEKCMCYMSEYEDDISKKLTAFFDTINLLKQEQMHLSISALIWKALQLTGYYDYASAMPMGEKRRANIDMLLERANQFEDGYYKGLFHFLRYIDKLKVQDVDFGEANTLADDADVVRIMSMHKSKGLEYPIVFVSGLGSQFNKQDTKEMLVLHSDYYLSSMVFSQEGRYKHQTFLRNAFQLIQANESIAEELRVLYVAMTRAKEKLYLTGATPDFNRLWDKLQYPASEDTYLLPYSIRNGAKSFLEHIIACMSRYDALAKTLRADTCLQMTVVPAEDVVTGAGLQLTKLKQKGEEIRDMALLQGDNPYYEAYKESFAYKYPYDAYTKIHGKLSISDIKKMKAYDGQGYDMDTEFMYHNKDAYEQMTANDKSAATNESKAATGALYGTLIHKFMELLPFEKLADMPTDQYDSFLGKQKQMLFEQGILDEDTIDMISISKIKTMLVSSLGKRMIAAAKCDRLYKEQQFSAGLCASQIYENVYSDMPQSEDVVIVQGIVDAFFYEDGELVLMDYKTDRADAEVLHGRYKAQLEYYGKILEQLTGCRVKEKIFYSFYLGKELPV